MQFGTLATPGLHGDIRETVAWARRAEEAGFTLLGTADSQGLFRDVYASMAVLARETSRVRLSTHVTNPLTRHPSVTASAIATIAEISDGRAILGIGVGDSALHTIDEHNASLSVLEEYILAVKGLLGGGEAVYRGKHLFMRWKPGPVPIFVAASGPQTLRLAGRVADGVIVAGGFTPEFLGESSAHLHAGAAAVGRDAGDIEVWTPVFINVSHSRAAAIEELLFILATRANHAFRATMEGKGVPREYRAPLRELIKRYRTEEHADPGFKGNGALVKELGLTEFLAGRFAVVGTASECAEQLRALEKAGVSRVLLSLHSLPTKSGWTLMDQFVKEVRPLLR